MATYVIGDVHGCFNELQRLFTIIAFDLEKDKAIFVGDLVGRGSQSLEVLDFVMGLGKAAIHVLGNYDIRLLGLLYGIIPPKRSDNLSTVLKNNNKQMYSDWLSSSKLLYYSKELNIVVSHAGIPPQWSVETAIEYANYFERYKISKGPSKTLQDIFLTPPTLNWKEGMQPEDIIRYTFFGFTKIKYCRDDGMFDEIYQGIPNQQPHSLVPWFTLRRQKQNDSERLIFGHWAALGLFQEDPFICCDTGCVWGEKLTAIKVDGEIKVFQVSSAFNANFMKNIIIQHGSNSNGSR